MRSTNVVSKENTGLVKRLSSLSNRKGGIAADNAAGQGTAALTARDPPSPCVTWAARCQLTEALGQPRKRRAGGLWMPPTAGGHPVHQTGIWEDVMPWNKHGAWDVSGCHCLTAIFCLTPDNCRSPQMLHLKNRNSNPNLTELCENLRQKMQNAWHLMGTPYICMWGAGGGCRERIWMGVWVCIYI